MQDNFGLLGTILYIRLEAYPNRVGWSGPSPYDHQPILQYRFLQLYLIRLDVTSYISNSLSTLMLLNV